MELEPNAWLAGPVAGSASTRTPSTYISGWFVSENLDAPRIRMREPLPTAPVARWMTTPAARALSRSCTPSMGALCVTSAALIVETAFPSLPISTACGVPVTTTCDNSRSFCSSVTFRFVSPTFTVSVTARNPIRRTCRTTVAPGRSSKWKRPLASVKTRRAVPVTATCTSPMGAPEDRLTTVPATEPPCASTAPGAAMPRKRVRPQQTEDNRMPRPEGEERLPILPARVGAASVHGEPHDETICSPTQFWSEQAMAVSMAVRGTVLGAALGLALAIACDSPFAPRGEGERVPVGSVIEQEVTGDSARSYSFAARPTGLYAVFLEALQGSALLIVIDS